MRFDIIGLTLCLVIIGTSADAKASPKKKKGCEVTLYENGGFTGAAAAYMKDNSAIAQHDRISSAVVKKGVWEFYADQGYGQLMGQYKPGKYAQLAPNDQLDSIKCITPTY